MNKEKRNFLNKVRMYGNLIERYDVYDKELEIIDETNTALLYEYYDTEAKMTYDIVIIMKNGEYVDYFGKEKK